MSNAGSLILLLLLSCSSRVHSKALVLALSTSIEAKEVFSQLAAGRRSGAQCDPVAPTAAIKGALSPSLRSPVAGRRTCVRANDAWSYVPKLDNHLNSRPT